MVRDTHHMGRLHMLTSASGYNYEIMNLMGKITNWEHSGTKRVKIRECCQVCYYEKILLNIVGGKWWHSFHGNSGPP